MVLLSVLPAPAAGHSFTTVGTTNGLGARIVPALLLDRDGFLWVGSREGLFRFDGYEALAHLPETGNPDSISDIDVRCLYQDSAGMLWAGTYSGGLNRYDPATGAFRNFRYDSSNPDSIVDDTITAISEGPAGQLWIASQGGLSRLSRSGHEFESFIHDPLNPSSLSDDRASSLHLGATGHLWIGTLGGGVNRWNPQNESFSRFNLAALAGGPPELNDVFALHESRDGTLWVGTRVGLVALDPAAGRARAVKLPQPGEYLPAITAIAAGEGSRLWLGTLAHGLLIHDIESGEWHAESGEQAGIGRHLRDQPQLSLALSADMLFIGTWSGGVYRTSSHATAFDLLNLASSETLRDSDITAVLANPESGRPWLGTRRAGPVRVDVRSNRSEYPASIPDDLSAAFVDSLAHAAGGRIWTGTNQGLYSFNDSGQQIGGLTGMAGRIEGLERVFVRTLLPVESDGLWIGSDAKGLFYLDHADGSMQQYRHQAGIDDSLSGDSITALLAGSRGELWVGTRSQGLNRCRTDDWSCTRFGTGLHEEPALGHFHVTALFRDRSGEIWVGTGGGGLNHVQQNGAGEVTGVRRWTTEEGLLDNTIMAIQQDLDDSLWLSTRQGLSRLHPGSGQIVNYVSESGLPTGVFNPGAAAADDRYLYFGSVHGLLSFPKGSRFARRAPARIGIAAIERTPPGGQSQPLFWADDRLSIAYGEVLSIKLATLDLSETPHEYAYRLQDDDPWIALATQRQLILHRLAPGLHRLQARGRDIFGSWGESDVLTLEVVPPWWMTNGFRVAVGVMVMLLAVAIHFARQSALQRRAREIQRLSAMREQALEAKLGSEAELAVLTPRQKEVLQLIAEGLSTREIADRLGVSIKTVEAHRANLMDRLDIHDVAGLVRLAIRARLVSEYD